MRRDRSGEEEGKGRVKKGKVCVVAVGDMDIGQTVQPLDTIRRLSLDTEQQLMICA